jgi:site-specific recombinase
MKRTSSTDEAAKFAVLLEELRASPPSTQCDWLARLVELIRPFRRESPEVAAARLRALTGLLESRPDLAAALRAHVVAQLTSRMHRILYAESGMLTDQSFRSGLTRRVLGRLLPPATDTDYLRSLIAEVFDQPHDHRWLAAIPRADWDALLDALDVRGDGFAPARRKCRHELLEALRLASTRLAAAGTDPALLQYLPALARHESPFLAQVDEVRAFIALHDRDEPVEDDGHLEVLLSQCDEYVERVRRRSHEAGVGVNLVFLLARIEQIIARLRLLHRLGVPDGAGDEASADGRSRRLDFFVRLVRQENRRNSLRDLFRGTTELLARRVTEQASRSGEHYISHTRTEFAAIYRAAAGAGLIIAFMALLKILTGKLDLPLLWEGTAYALNYGLGFVIIHLLHLTIATKQPAMTAATLAASLDGRDDRETRIDALAELAAEVSRTQWISIAGNVSIAMLTAFAIAMIAGRFLGWEPVDPAKAAHLLHDLHPLRGLALLYAAIAGVYLFLSGLISGYYDNLSLYHQVPQRLRRVKWLRGVLGPERLERLAIYIEHNLGALAGNFLFGCMLGYTPIVGQLLGLPLDIRHVAFASANLAYGLDGVDFAVSHRVVIVSFAGVLLIGLVNLLVSFSLALKVALRSRGITREQTEGLWGRVLRRFIARPRDFFWPPPAEPVI